MKRKILLLSALLAGNFSPAFAQVQMGVNLLGNYNFGSYNFAFKEGNIKTENSSLDPAVSITGRYQFKNRNLFIGTGIRLVQTQSFFDVRPTMQSFVADRSYHKWTVQNVHMAIPVYGGKTLYIGKHIPVQVWGGASFGLQFISMYGFESTQVKANNDDDIIASNFIEKPEPGAKATYLSLDAGAVIYPFKRLPGIGINLSASYDLRPNPSYRFTGYFENRSQGKRELYGVDFTRKFVNLQFGLNYTFGMRKK